MTKTVHSFYQGILAFIILAVTCYLAYTGFSYYELPIEERFYHPRHNWFKPSGTFGHGMGIIGTLMILFGVSIYIARKRYNFMSKFLRLKYLLEFHIFLCILGPILILFHTAFKFGGIVSVALWSMLAEVASGVIGRFIYIQIPRTIEGRELSLNEVKGMKQKITDTLIEKAGEDEELMQIIRSIAGSKDQNDTESNVDKSALRKAKRILKKKNIEKAERAAIIKMINDEITLSKRIKRLLTMQKLFKYWHVAHLPFALIMLIILVIHVAVTLAFGYKWIF